MYIVHQKQQPHLWIAAHSSLVMEYFMNINYLHYAEASSGIHWKHSLLPHSITYALLLLYQRSTLDRLDATSFEFLFFYVEWYQTVTWEMLSMDPEYENSTDYNDNNSSMYHNNGRKSGTKNFNFQQLLDDLPLNEFSFIFIKIHTLTEKIIFYLYYHKLDIYTDYKFINIFGRLCILLGSIGFKRWSLIGTTCWTFLHFFRSIASLSWQTRIRTRILQPIWISREGG